MHGVHGIDRSIQEGDAERRRDARGDECPVELWLRLQSSSEWEEATRVVERIIRCPGVNQAQSSSLPRYVRSTMYMTSTGRLFA